MILHVTDKSPSAFGLSAAVRTGLGRLAAVALKIAGSRHPRLDLDHMEPHMLHDLGFLDGRDARYDREETR